VGVAALAAVGTLALTWPEPVGPQGRTIAFYDGKNMDWRVPRYGEYGQGSSGMFGLLPAYLRLQGYLVGLLSGELTAAKLSGVHVLVLINLAESFSPAERDLIAQ